jgi:hypothetical protein
VIRGSDEPFPRTYGEVGVLRAAVINDQFDKVYLRMKIEGREYLGALLFDDFGFCYEIYSLLRSYVGCPMQEIGEIDLSYSL